MACVFREIERALFFSDVPEGILKKRRDSEAGCGLGLGRALFFDDLQSVSSQLDEQQKAKKKMLDAAKEKMEARVKKMEKVQEDLLSQKKELERQIEELDSLKADAIMEKDVIVSVYDKVEQEKVALVAQYNEAAKEMFGVGIGDLLGQQ